MVRLGDYKIPNKKSSRQKKATKAKKSNKQIKIGQAENKEESAEVIEQN
jgi:hypothetical protein